MTATLRAPFLSAADIAGRIPHAKRQGKGWIARCPAHDDKNPSLSISSASDGRTLLKCHAGCEFKAVVAALGVSAAQLYPTDSRTQRPMTTSPTTEELHATFVYTDALGAPLFRVLRYHSYDTEHRRVGKRFWPQKHLGAGEYGQDMTGATHVLYNLPAIIEASAEERTIFFVEGELKADRLIALGLAATTIQGGSSAPWREPYGETLRGADVVILPDNDEPGRKHGVKVATALHGLAKSVRTVALPDLPVKGDVCDYLDAGHGTADLLTVIASGGATTPDADPEDSGDTLPAPTCMVRAPEQAPIEWLVKGFWPAGELGLIVGDGGSYKSTTTLHLAAAIAGGRDAFCKFETVQRPVLIVSAEDGAGVLYNRTEAICRGHGWNFTEVATHMHYLALAGVSLSNASHVAQLAAMVRQLDAGLVVLDPLAELTDGEENSASEMRTVIKAARSLTKPTGAAVMLVHHAGKVVKDKREQDRIRGSSAFHAAARAIYLMDPRDEGVGVTCLKFSRAAKRAPFVLARTIEADPANEAHWIRARFEFTGLKEAALTRAETHILDQLEGGVRLSTTELKTAAHGTGISGPDLARALKLLEMKRRLAFDGGEPGKAKQWYLVAPPLTLPSEVGQGRQGTPSTLPGKVEGCPARYPGAPGTLPALIRARSGQGTGDALARFDASRPDEDAA